MQDEQKVIPEMDEMDGDNPILSPKSLTVAKLLNDECSAMINYSLSTQLKVPGVITEKYVKVQESKLTTKSVRQLTDIHSDLSNLISPASPKTLMFLQEESNKKYIRMLGAVPLIRLMMGISIVCLLGVFLMSLHPEINGNESNFSLLENSGTNLLLNELFLLFAAGLGASFSALYNSQIYIRSRTYDPIYDSSYIVLFVMGLISGTLLATLIPVETIMGGNEAKASALKGFGKPMLAILGGFSASIVYSILDRMKSTLNTMVQGDARKTIEANTQMMQAQQEEKSLKAKAALGNKINLLQNEIGNSTDPDLIKKKITAFREEVYSS